MITGLALPPSAARSPAGTLAGPPRPREGAKRPGDMGLEIGRATRTGTLDDAGWGSGWVFGVFFSRSGLPPPPGAARPRGGPLAAPPRSREAAKRPGYMGL